jgi:hypothetical protein
MRWLINLALFLTPFLVFFTYARWANARRSATGRDPLLPPWYWLAVLGLVFAVTGFFIMRAFENPHTGEYVPAAVGPDGRVIPGHYVGDDDRPARVAPPQQPPPEAPPPPPQPRSP